MAGIAATAMLCFLALSTNTEAKPFRQPSASSVTKAWDSSGVSCAKPASQVDNWLSDYSALFQNWQADANPKSNTSTHHMAHTDDLNEEGEPGDDNGDGHAKLARLEPMDAVCLTDNDAKKSQDLLMPLMHYNIDAVDRLRTNYMKTRVKAGESSADPMKLKWQRHNYRGFAASFNSAWVRKDLSGDAHAESKFKCIQKALGALRIGFIGAPDAWKQERAVATTLHPGGLNWPRRLSQSDSFYGKSHQKLTPATGAQDDFFVNVKDGVLVLANALSPFEALKGKSDGGEASITTDDLPIVRRLSDLLLRSEWHLLHHSNKDHNPYKSNDNPTGVSAYKMSTMLSWLNVVLVQDISQPLDTLQIIRGCLKVRGWEPAHDRSWPKWEDREIYPIGHWCFEALLSTPGSAWIAWFLGQHKDTSNALGHKTLRSVTIFWGECSDDLNAKGDQYPNLLWEVVDASFHMDDVMRHNREIWMETHTMHRIDYPQLGANMETVGGNKG